MKLNANSLSNKGFLLFVYYSINNVIIFGYIKSIKEIVG